MRYLSELYGRDRHTDGRYAEMRLPYWYTWKSILKVPVGINEIRSITVLKSLILFLFGYIHVLVLKSFQIKVAFTRSVGKSMYNILTRKTKKQLFVFAVWSSLLGFCDYFFSGFCPFKTIGNTKFLRRKRRFVFWVKQKNSYRLVLIEDHLKF